MALFEWKNEYSLGHKLIDQQHKQLFVLANSVYNISISEKSRNDLEKILHELKDYTIYHFQTEEDIYFEKIRPIYKIHKEEHEKFKLKAEEFISAFDSGTDIDIVEFLAFLIDWLTDHIQGVDKKHFSYIIKKSF